MAASSAELSSLATALDELTRRVTVHADAADAAKDEGTRVIMKAGIAGLGTGFASRSESERVQALKSIETSKFFRLMREKTVQVLYSTPMAYAYFGYEGEAFSKGGYLVRGFNDLRWLPEVPIGESGPMPVKA